MIMLVSTRHVSITSSATRHGNPYRIIEAVPVWAFRVRPWAQSRGSGPSWVLQRYRHERSSQSGCSNRWRVDPGCSIAARHQAVARRAHSAARLTASRSADWNRFREGLCATWDGNSGANACFVCEAEDLIEGTTNAPYEANPADHEMRVAGWERRMDCVSVDLVPAFFDERLLYALPDTVRKSVTVSTRAGGVPQWIQGPTEAPKSSAGWRFAAQLDSSYSLLRAQPGARGSILRRDPV